MGTNTFKESNQVKSNPEPGLSKADEEILNRLIAIEVIRSEAAVKKVIRQFKRDVKKLSVIKE